MALSLRRNGSTGIEWLWAFVRGGGERDRGREGGRKATRVLIGMIPLICALCMLARAEAHSNLLSFYAWKEWISAFGVQNLKHLWDCTILACLFHPPCLVSSATQVRSPSTPIRAHSRCNACSRPRRPRPSVQPCMHVCVPRTKEISFYILRWFPPYQISASHKPF